MMNDASIFQKINLIEENSYNVSVLFPTG